MKENKENILVLSRLIRAESIWSRVVGLLGKSSLPDGHGLLIIPCNQVHTMCMRFSIDVVFLDSNNTIVKICRNLKPWRLSPLVRKAEAVLELNQGGAEGLKMGDQLRIEAG